MSGNAVLRKLRILIGLDLLGSLFLAGVLWYVSPTEVPNAFAKDLYGLGATVLAVVFSVFVAALAIIMAGDDSGFSAFLSEEGSLGVIMFGFKFTLWLLFVGLMAAVFLYALSSWWIVNGVETQQSVLSAGLVFLLLYGVSATLTAALAAIQHSQLHIAYLRLSEAEREKLRRT